ncbi:MAG: hypothetical protein ACRDFS_13310 [Chloroflexota bacterium]
MGESDSVEDELKRAVRDLWSMVQDSGSNHVVFMAHDRRLARVERFESGYRVSWEEDDGTWLSNNATYENPREAAFHAYQGPH